MTRILFVTPVIHHPAFGGPELRIRNTIKTLHSISELHVLIRLNEKQIGGPRATAFYKTMCASFRFAPPEGNVFAPGNESTRDFSFVLEVANYVSADIIWLGFGNISYYLLKYIKNRSEYKVVLDTDSVWSRFILRQLPYSHSMDERRSIQREGHEKEEEESWGTKMADITTAVSEVDAEYYRKLARSPERVHIFPNVIDSTMYQRMPTKADGLMNPCVFLAGTFWPGSPMEDAARWFINEILPVLRVEVPVVTLHIVGRQSDTVLAEFAHRDIQVHGQVDSVLPYLYYANVSIVPLRFESGTRFKILEAGACKVSVVSTTLGVEGLPVIHGEHLLVADTPRDFAHAIRKLINDQSTACCLATKLNSLVREYYDISILVRHAERIVAYLLYN